MEWKRIRKSWYWWLLHGAVLVVLAYLFWESCSIQSRLDPNAQIWRDVQTAYIRQYTQEKTDIIARADHMGEISIFGDSDSFSNRNIQKTKSDIQPLLDQQLQPLASPFVEKWLKADLSDYMVLLLLFLLIYQFQQEQRDKMENVIRLAAGGRYRLLFRRLGLGMMLSFFYTAIQYLVRFCIAARFYGIWQQWDAPVASLPDFSLCVWKINILWYTVVHFLWKSAAYSIWLTVLYCFFCVWKDKRIAWLFSVTILFLEYLAYRFIPSSSLFHVLSWLNLFAILDPYHTISTYVNVNLFGIPWSNKTLVILGSGIAFLASVAILLFLQKRRQESSFFKKIRCALDTHTKRIHIRIHLDTLFSLEGKKLFFLQRGLLLLLLLGIIQGYRIEEQAQYYSKSERFRQSYYEQFQGILTEERMALAEAKKEELETFIRNAKSTAELQSWQEEKAAFDEIYGELQRVFGLYQEGIPAVLVNPDGYERILHFGIDTISNLLLCTVWILLVSIGSWHQEKRDGMIALLRISPKGVSAIQRQKLIWIVIYTFLVFSMVFGVSVGNCLYRFPLSGLQASIKSLPWMAQYSGPIWFYLAGYYLILFGILNIVWITGVLIGYCRCLKRK